MPYAKKRAPRARKRPAARRRKAVVPKTIFRAAQNHSAVVNWYNSSYVPSTAGRIKVGQLTNIVKGENYADRKSNLIYVNNVSFRETVKNQSTTTRYMRLMVVSLRGSLDAADVTNFTDLFYDSNYVKTGVTGNDIDTIMRINTSEYVKLFDRTYKIPGTNSNENSSRMIKANIPIKKYVSYPVNAGGTTANYPRKNPIYLISLMCESSGVAPSGTGVSADGELQTHWTDVEISRPLPGRRH